jgi:hypothetical protein
LSCLSMTIRSRRGVRLCARRTVSVRRRGASRGGGIAHWWSRCRRLAGRVVWVVGRAGCKRFCPGVRTRARHRGRRNLEGLTCRCVPVPLSPPPIWPTRLPACPSCGTGQLRWWDHRRHRKTRLLGGDGAAALNRARRRSSGGRTTLSCGKRLPRWSCEEGLGRAEPRRPPIFAWRQMKPSKRAARNCDSYTPGMQLRLAARAARRTGPWSPDDDRREKVTDRDLNTNGNRRYARPAHCRRGPTLASISGHYVSLLDMQRHARD